MSEPERAGRPLTPPAPPPVTPPVVPGPGGQRWVVLVAGLFAMTAGCTFQYGLAYLIPAFRAEGLSLEQAGILVACPTAGLLLTLVAWGAAADRWGERLVLGAGLALAGTLLLVGATVHGTAALGACLVAAGAAGASVYAASGRLILGWFPARQRGLAMGIRQSAQPLGVAVAALALPSIGAHGRAPALALPGHVLPGRRGRWSRWSCVIRRGRHARPAAHGGSPYRGGPHRTATILWRIHAASALLVVPQFAVATFALVFLVDAHGLDPVTAGRILAVAQACGAFSRLGAGVWSDRVGSRMRPMRAARGGHRADPGRAGGRGGRPGAVGGRRAVRRGDHLGQHQRPGLHRRGRARRIILGGAGARHPEHRPERVRGRHAAGPGRGDRRGGVRRRVRGGRAVPAGRGGPGAGERGTPGCRPASRAGPPPAQPGRGTGLAAGR